jgi:hypothetical protein
MGSRLKQKKHLKELEKAYADKEAGLKKKALYWPQ